MAVDTKLAAKKRTEKGSTACRRLRRSGHVPGIVYGHHQETVPVALATETLVPLINAGTRVVELNVDGASETVMFRAIQWDTFGSEIEHIDLLRIDPTERVEVEVPITLKGIAPGAMSGGILDFHLHSVSLECLAIQIPDSIQVKIGELQIGQAIHVSDLELPPNTKVLNEPETVVVQVKEALEELPEEGAEPGPAEPELVGRKVKEEEEEEDKK